MADFQKQTVQWFPGHMAKTRRIIKESLSLVDGVVELGDVQLSPELFVRKFHLLHNSAFDGDRAVGLQHGQRPCWLIGRGGRRFLRAARRQFAAFV